MELLLNVSLSLTNGICRPGAPSGRAVSTFTVKVKKIQSLKFRFDTRTQLLGLLFHFCISAFDENVISSGYMALH
jgi:hypothetical protein